MNDLRHLVDGGLEADLLGCVFRDSEAYLEASFLERDDFTKESHRVIWNSIKALAGSTYPTVDVVSKQLLDSGKLEAAGGFSGLLDIHGRGIPGVSTAVAGFARELRKKTSERQALRLAAKIAKGIESGEGIDLDALAELSGIQPGIESSASVDRVEDLPAVGASDETIDYIRYPEIPKGGAVIGVTGDSGSGKSTVVRAWVRDAIAIGIPCLILDRESPRSIATDCMARLGMEDGPLLRWWGGWNGDVPGPDSAAVRDWVRLCEPKPIVVSDAVIAFLDGNENEAAVMRGFMHGGRQLADMGATAIMIHHDGKAESARDFRGSSDYKAAVDQAFHVTNISQDGKLDRLSLRCFKSRYGFSGSVVYLYAGGRFIRDQREDAPAITTAEQLTSLLRTNPGVGSKEFEDLAGKAGLGRNRARDFLNDSVLGGSVRREGVGRNRLQHYLVEGQK